MGVLTVLTAVAIALVALLSEQPSSMVDAGCCCGCMKCTPCCCGCTCTGPAQCIIPPLLIKLPRTCPCCCKNCCCCCCGCGHGHGRRRRRSTEVPARAAAMTKECSSECKCELPCAPKNDDASAAKKAVFNMTAAAASRAKRHVPTLFLF